MAKEKNSRRFQSVVIIVVCLISVVLVGVSAAILAEYSRSMHDGAGVIGLINSDTASDVFRESIDNYKAKAEKFAKEVLADNYTSVEDFSFGISRRGKSTEAMFIRYFKGGIEYSLSNQPYDMTTESKQVIVGSRMEVSFCAGIIEDRQYSISAVAYCIPLKNCAYADCIVLYYPVDTVVGSVELPESSDAKSQITTICSQAGEIVSLLRNNGYDLQQHNNIYEFLRKTINDKVTIDKIKAIVEEGRSDYFTVTVSGHDNILAVSGIREHGTTPFAVIALYKADDIYSAAYSTFTTLLGVFAIFFVVLIFLAGYFIFSYRASERRIKKLKEYNEILDCPSDIMFQRVATDIIAQNRGSQFAVVVVDIRHFDYMTDHLGSDQMINELKRIRDFYLRYLQLKETYGYAGNGRFVLLFHYRDLETLGSRIKLLSNYLGISKTAKSGERITLSAYGGIYLTSSDSTVSVERMIDMAILAENAAKYPFDFESFRLYNEKLHSSNAMNEYIEVNMQSALDNKLFKVFYQPKLNIEGNRPDGCEALVRWYNPETGEYMQPGLFLPLFEENRFIVKLDKYVYEQVCIYIATKAAEHSTIYPVSVNVSRITATDSDFLNYYIATKKKYNIPDGFLTIEFTESFAFEDYEQLRETVNVLHSNGFMCSIDDFGSGFSSYNLLKELPMDEIKLDRFFIDKGISDERDFKVLSSVIQLGRGLKMKVTQEGVETKAQMDMLKKLGCNVIQGFYYSRPLVEHDYDDFLKRKFLN
ncbi:MAG: EAL domain-containing protein [Clostridia bacterium]|nr:EAL domain-containing protein [Clostridia bacterium]